MEGRLWPDKMLPADKNAGAPLCPGSRRESTKSYRRRTLPLALLAPDIVGAILTGRTEQTMMLEQLERPLAMSWDHQRSLLSAASTPITGTMQCTEGLTMPEDRNVLGEKLDTCSIRPMTGFYRTGCCETGAEDVGAHVVCVEVTREFLAFSRTRGNDLSTPVPEMGFPGLKPGDRWCLCAARWKEALDAGMAPRVVLRATHEEALDYLVLADLRRHALDLA
jgi:uncharacterized protein